MLLAVQCNSEAMKYIPQELREDREVIRAASRGVRMQVV